MRMIPELPTDPIASAALELARSTESEARSTESESVLHYPRLAMVGSLVDAIVEHAARSDAAAPRYSIPGELLHERRQHGVTRMEQAAAQSPWGD
jgi:hypothetical protein